MFFRHRAYDLEHPRWHPDTGAAGDVGFACVAYAATFFQIKNILQESISVTLIEFQGYIGVAQKLWNWMSCFPLKLFSKRIQTPLDCYVLSL